MTTTPPGAPRTLFFALGPRSAYRDTLVAGREVFSSPDVATTPQGAARRCVKSPLGAFDVRRVSDQLPEEEAPELLVAKVDATLRCMPRNLGALRCPKVLIVGDTHHLERPITALLQYALEERFDLLVTENNRHHARFFQAAGFPRVAWLPCCTWSPHWHAVPAQGDGRVVFVGQAGALHPYRRAVLHAAARRGLPVDRAQLPAPRAAERYRDASVALNVSLNGDLNLRVFEVLGAGGLLLTDRLSPESGLDRLFDVGRELDTFGGVDELVDKARHYLAHPDQAHAIRLRGRARIEADHAPEVQTRRLLDLVFDGVVDARFALDDLPATSVAIPAGVLLQGVAHYEALQELHRTACQTRVFHGEGARLTAWLGGLPRLTVHPWADHTAFTAEAPALFGAPSVPGLEHVLLIGRAVSLSVLGGMLASFRGRHVVVEGAAAAWTAADYSAVDGVLRPWGFAPVAGRPGQYQRADAAALFAQALASAPETLPLLLRQLVDQGSDPTTCVAVADALRAAGSALAQACYEQAARLDRGHLRALARLGSMPVIDRASPPRTTPPRRILIVTNLFPPEELGGYGRKMWEAAAVLTERGHDVAVLTASAPQLAREAEAPDPCAVVSRTLRLAGEWKDGRVQTWPGPETRHNADTAIATARARRPDVVLLGNVDLLGTEIVHGLLAEGLPALHWIGAATPGFPVDRAPRAARYRALPASRWVAAQLEKAGYPFEKMDVVHPGARLARFERALAPWPRGLRIAFAGLVLPFKGPQTLVEALVLLHQRGVPFTCTIAGQSTLPAFVSTLKEYLAGAGLRDAVEIPGFLDRAGVARLLEQSNVFVFPTVIEEAFGISQVEAMAAGLAVVSTATGGAGEVAIDGETALVVAPEDPQALAEALMRLHESPALVERLGAAGRRRAAELSVEAAVVQIEHLTEELLETPADPALPATTPELATTRDVTIEELAASVRAMAKSGQTEQALTLSWQTLGQVGPLYGAAGAAALAAGRPAQALAALELGAHLGDTSPETTADRVEALLLTGAASRALGLAETLPSSARRAVLTGRALVRLGRAASAIGLLEGALADEPGAAAAAALGNALSEMGRLSDAVAAFRRAVALDPSDAESHSSLFVLSRELCDVVAARESLEHAMALAPDSPRLVSNRLYLMNAEEGLSDQAIFEAHRVHGDKLMASVAAARGKPFAPRSPGARLRIGYVSPDFRGHAVAFFMAPILRHHDPARVEVFCYHNHAHTDRVTRYLQDLRLSFRSIAGLPDEEVASLVRADRIDVLVDLAGHTAGQRLRLFAMRPAPAQVAYLGYPNTTGLRAVDYRIGDAFADPPEADGLWAEKLLRPHPCFLAYEAPAGCPPVSELPAARTGVVTFGSFAHPRKLNPGLVALWSRVLHVLPGSRLLLKGLTLGERVTAEIVAGWFHDHGIDADRLQIEPQVPSYVDHLKAYGRVDVALDTFPYHGTTTTCEALWMGVPVVTLAGAAHRSRVGVSLLRNVGLPELIASTEDEYVELAARLAGDIGSLAVVRAGLRQRVTASPLGDAAGLTRALEDAFEAVAR